MKNEIFSIIFLWAILQVSAFAQMGINSTGAAPASSAMLDVSSTSKGFLPPRMTTAQRSAIASPAAGLLVFDTTLNQLYIFSSGNWVSVAAPSYPRLSSDAIDALTSPQTGDLAYDLTFKCLKHYNGTRWLSTNQDPCNTLPNSTAWAALGTGIAQEANSVAVDNQGNVYITGQFGGTTTFGSINLRATGNSNIFVAKYNSSGVVQWAVKAAGSGTFDKGTSIKVDATGNVYITGTFTNTAIFGNTSSTSVTSAGADDIFIAKYNNLGVVQWVQRAGGTGLDGANALALDPSGNIYITGFFRNTATFGTTTLTSAGNSDVFVAKCENATGAFQAANSAGGTGNDGGNSIAYTPNGTLRVAGYFNNTAIFGSTSLVSAGGSDIFSSTYLSSSNQWGTSFGIGGTGNDFATSIFVDNGSQNYYIAGAFTDIITFGLTSLTSAGETDVFIAKYSYVSTPLNLWAKSAGGTGFDIAYGVATDGSGNVYATGYFEQTADFGSTTLVSNGGLRDIFTTKYNSDGINQWAQKNGGTSFDTGYSIACDATNNIYIAGSFISKMCFGATMLNNGTGFGNHDIFVGRLKE